MRIFGIGLTRTGTTSLRKAMRILGVDLKWISQVKMHHDAAFVQDHMCIPLDRYKKLFAEYPRAKFILTTRATPDMWYDSICRWAEKRKHNEAIAMQREGQYGYPYPQGHKEHFINLYKDHNIQVRAFFIGNPNFLELCVDVDDMWEKLCPFLGVNIPNVKYPHTNKTK